ncbi:CPBP family intramembrane glutamic endopeptidase [Anseongella ginsenosidimutans]|uniref:CPBP family intramembrane glutamic endopeptidase n=1 Tax=Anseongella ginsenosidimutans TaxID=496056 RepID=UPI0011CA69F8|nr:CPBP family intramembrane glutamic endopeptidase [Anseongella ginsenosidimutans]QEC51537.1 CPBP family intramembrane metalloprotease [Anseongella ginsenosidimutans]
MSKYPGNIEAVLALSISVVSAGLLLLPAAGLESNWITIAGLLSGIVILGISFVQKRYLLVHLCLFFLLLFGWKNSPLWPSDLPTGLVAPFLSYLLIVLLIPPLRKTLSWFRWGGCSRKAMIAGLLILAFSLPALLMWAMHSENVIEYYVYLFHPEILYIELVIFALLFAVINAVTQEVIFRGVFQDALEAAFGKGAYAILVQALIFGLIHLQGIPSGLAGVLMAFSYGCALGILRKVAGGCCYP